MRSALAVGVMQLVLLASSVARADDDPDAWKREVDDPDYTPSTCHIETDVVSVSIRQQRIPDRSPDVLTFAVGPYGILGANTHDPTRQDSTHSGTAWRATLETYFDTLAVFGDVRGFGIADTRDGVPAQRTLVDLSLGLYFHDIDMHWVPAHRHHHTVHPAHCGVDRSDLVPFVGVITLVAHDDTHPELDGVEIAPTVGFMWRWLEAGPYLSGGVQVRGESFYLVASHRAGARVAVQGMLGALLIGPEMLVVGNKEIRTTLDFGISFDL
jgi:hypothetical protein